jgi:uncharacterized protein with HEPN domain
MHESASRVLEYVGSMSREEFLSDSRTVDAVIRNLAVIGEAANKVPSDIRRQYPAVEWKKMAGLRDIVVHDYFGIDEDIIWDVVSVKMKELLQQMETLTVDLVQQMKHEND